MPYVKKSRRLELQSESPLTAGELNFTFTDVILQYLKIKGESYQTYNDIAGALLNAYTELYRRKIGPYEDQKINQNGEVY